MMIMYFVEKGNAPWVPLTDAEEKVEEDFKETSKEERKDNDGNNNRKKDHSKHRDNEFSL